MYWLQRMCPSTAVVYFTFVVGQHGRQGTHLQLLPEEAKPNVVGCCLLSKVPDRLCAGSLALRSNALCSSNFGGILQAT